MAGHAEKKTLKHAEAFSKYYLWAILGVNVLYFIWKVLFHWSSMGKWNILGFFLFSAVSYLTYQGIGAALSMGTSYEYYMDFYIINLGTQFLVTFSDWGWLVYLTVPCFIGYKIVKLGMDWVFTPRADEVEDDASKKRREKKERQGEKPKFKKIR